MERFKVVLIRVILAIMILSLNNGCGNNMPQKNDQVENVSQEEMEAVGDSFTLKMDEKTFCKEDACILLLSDSVAGCLKGMRAPVLKIEFADGIKIAKGISGACSEPPCDCDYFYYYDYDERVVLSDRYDRSGKYLHLIKINERSRKELEACKNSFALKLQDYEITYSDEYSYALTLSDSVVSCLKKMRVPVLKIEFADGTKIAKGMLVVASGIPYGCDLVYFYDLCDEWIMVDSMFVLKKRDSFGKKQ
ncbi:MAG: hypothetical protein K6F48_03175 [Paludibacteraceae bacterium]|nr:hypothetical protein [Paludibacteraceae bacterium]